MSVQLTYTVTCDFCKAQIGPKQEINLCPGVPPPLPPNLHWFGTSIMCSWCQRTALTAMQQAKQAKESGA